MWLACCVTVMIIERQGVEKDIKQLPKNMWTWKNKKENKEQYEGFN